MLKRADTPLISIRNLTYSYLRQPVLHNLSHDFSRNSLTAILGPNGGGKSTLLKLIMGLLEIQTGEIEFFGMDRTKITYLPQLAEMDRHFPIKVKDVVAMGLWNQKGIFSSYSNQDEQRILEALDQVGLSGFASRHVSALSGGQFQRVLFARAILQDSEIFLLDEPFTAVDTATSDILMRLIRSWHEKGKTIFVVLHDYDVVRDFFPNALLLARSIVACGPPKEVLTTEVLLRAHQMVENAIDIEKIEKKDTELT